MDYYVKHGDSLWSIAQKKMGNGRLWEILARANFTREQLYIGQKIWIPDQYIRNSDDISPNFRANSGRGRMTADIALARGFVFIVVEVVPEMGSNIVIRKEYPGKFLENVEGFKGEVYKWLARMTEAKVLIIPRDFSMIPTDSLSALSPADHVQNSHLGRSSPFLSTSGELLGAPTIEGKPVLIDLNKVKAAGGQVMSVLEVVTDLQRYMAENPGANHHVKLLIDTIFRVEQEVLIKGNIPREAIQNTNFVHHGFINDARKIWENVEAENISREEGIRQLEKLKQSARNYGNLGRALSVVGVVFTTVDLVGASRQSIVQRSFRPIGAETIRQVGGWGGAISGAKIGGTIGALCGIETGPGAFVTGLVGALIFGLGGYVGADWVADKIYQN
ncbi:hypothetical protein AGMMS49545_23360 [Betaproteobacteria bacterium]|nr:hypothetical protein AGMMS49545_23360 [Betaproteobacteria bacterium]